MPNAKNLTPGRKRANPRQAALDAASKVYLEAAIAVALSDKYADDDEVRFALAKVGDFVVTDAARAKVKADKARAVFTIIVEQIKRAVLEERRLSIKGFADFTLDVDDGHVNVFWGQSGWEPLWKDGRFYYEKKTARISQPEWKGGDHAGWTFTDVRAATWSDRYDGNGVFRLLEVPRMLFTMQHKANDYPLNAAVIVDAKSSLDNSVRTYKAHEFQPMVFVSKHLVSTNNGTTAENSDYDVVYTVLPHDQAAAVAYRTAMGWHGAEIYNGSKKPIFGPYSAMTIDDYEYVQQIKLVDVNQQAIAWEDFTGLPVSEVMRTYPRRTRMYKGRPGPNFPYRYGVLWRIPKEQFFSDWKNDVRRHFIDEQKLYPKADKRKTKLKVNFHKKFKKALNKKE